MSWWQKLEDAANNWRPAPRTVEEVAARLASVPGAPWTIEPHGADEVLYSGRLPGRHGLNLVTLTDWDSRGDAMRAFLEAAPEDVGFLLAEVARLQAENAEYRAALGIAAPEGWQPCVEGLWERPCGPIDPEYGECAAGWLVVVEDCHRDQPWHWAWYVGGGEVRAEGTEATCLGALAAAEAALRGDP